MDYSKLIKKIRKIMILSQTELAGMLGVSYTTISRWEQGHYEPTIKMKRKISELCKLNKITSEDL